MKNNIKKILYTEEQIAAKTAELAAAINADYKDCKGEILLVGILRGSVMFFADLIRRLDMPVVIDFMVISSYGAGTKSSGEVRIVKDLESPLEGRHVIVVEDIVDSGLTLKFLRNTLLNRNPASLKLCALLDKPSRRRTEISADYIGFTVPDEFLVGYGLDWAQKYRNLPYIGVLKEEVYTNANL